MYYYECIGAEFLKKGLKIDYEEDSETEKIMEYYYELINSIMKNAFGPIIEPYNLLKDLCKIFTFIS